MASRLEPWSLRKQIVLLVLAIVLPAVGLVGWLLAGTLQQARGHAEAQVRILAEGAAGNLERYLHHSELTLGRLAARPLVKALDPNRCDPVITELVGLNPEFTTLGLRDLQGNSVCAYPPSAVRQTSVRDAAWFTEGVRRGAFTVSNAFQGRQVVRWLSVLTLPVRDDSGAVIGVLVQSIDLLKLSEDVLRSVPRHAVVAASDRQRVIVARSFDAASFVGKTAPPSAIDAVQGAREGFFSGMDVDGVQRLYAFVTVRGAEWTMVAGLPETEALADYHATLRRSVGLGAAVLLLALWLAWRLGAAIVNPIANLANAAAMVGSGNSASRALVTGPAEIATVARQFNQMLDARDLGEAALRESEERFRSLTELSADWYWEQDEQLRLTYHSAGFDRNSGTTSKKLIGMRRWEEPGRVPVHGNWDEHRATLEAHLPFRDFEYLRTDEHGNRRLIAISGVPIFDAAGHFKGFRGVGSNITERKQRDEDLRRFRTAMDATTDAIYLVDRSSLRFIDVNAAACAALGLTREQIFARGPEGVLSMSREELTRMYDAVIAGGGAAAVSEMQRTRRDGSQVWMELRRHAQRTEDGWMIVTVARDITIRKQAEFAVQESEQRYRALTEWSPEPIVVHRDGTIIYVNPAAVRMFGAGSEQDLKAKSMFELIHPDSLPLARQRVKALTEGSGSLPAAEMIFVKFDGTPVFTEILGTLMVYGGVPAVHAVLHDIGKRKEDEAARASLEAQLRESQKMEAVGTLAGGIAHDFNNIIATILGNADLARQDVTSNPQALESLEEIRKAGTRARDLVQQILSFSRRETTERKPVWLAAIVEESARLLRATLPARVHLEVQCDTDVPAVLADATQFVQVLINLASNAVQAMRNAPGLVSFRLDAVTLDASLADNHPRLRAMYATTPSRVVRLNVSDNGPGMDAVTLERIFEPFFTTKPVGEGTGLGLSVVHGIVQAHGGVIVVDSKPGMGSAFTIYLPATDTTNEVRTPNPAAATAVIPKGVGYGRHILYVDDDASLVFLVKRLLERRGYRVSAHTSQRDALAALRADADSFDLVLTDYNMPGLSGLDLAREVRTIRRDLPVAVASGFIDETLRAHAASAGVRELIFKASAVEEFCGLVEGLLTAAPLKA